MAEMMLISADSHVNEPGDLWVEFVGVENIMWSSDYPHTVSTWPHSREVVDRDFKDVPANERRQIVRDNAARLYGFSA